MRALATTPVRGLFVILLGACAPSVDPGVSSPVQSAVRTQERMQGQGAYNASYSRRGDDGVVIGKVVAPAPVVWDAMAAAMAGRGIKPTILDRASGRMGDTSLVLMRRFTTRALSTFFTCGSSMTGERADEDRLRSVFLAQTSRLPADTIAIAVHFSALATKVSGAESTVQCTSNGRAESEFLDEVLRRVAVR